MVLSLALALASASPSFFCANSWALGGSDCCCCCCCCCWRVIAWATALSSAAAFKAFKFSLACFDLNKFCILVILSSASKSSHQFFLLASIFCNFCCSAVVFLDSRNWRTCFCILLTAAAFFSFFFRHFLCSWAMALFAFASLATSSSISCKYSSWPKMSCSWGWGWEGKNKSLYSESVWFFLFSYLSIVLLFSVIDFLISSSLFFTSICLDNSAFSIGFKSFTFFPLCFWITASFLLARSCCWFLSRNSRREYKYCNICSWTLILSRPVFIFLSAWINSCISSFNFLNCCNSGLSSLAASPCSAGPGPPRALSPLPPPIICFVWSVNSSMYFSKYTLPKLITVLSLFVIKGKANRSVCCNNFSGSEITST